MFKFIRRIKAALKADLGQADLTTLLNSLNPKNSYVERLNSLSEIMEWIRLPIKSQTESSVPDFIHSRDVRVKFLFQYLDRNQVQAQNLADTLKEIIVPGAAVGLYCLTGLSENQGFFHELSNRLVQRALPDTYTEKDISSIFKILFKEEEDAQWLEHSFKQILPLFLEFTQKHEISFVDLKADRFEAMVILSAQVATLGTTKDIRRRVDEPRLIDSSFLRLNAAINRDLEGSHENVLRLISQSRLDLQSVRQNIEESGVSVDLIFRLEKISSILDRIEMLIYLGKDYMKDTKPIIIGQFMGRLVRDELRNLGVKSYLKENLHLLTRKIVERAGEKGQHYIANTRDEKLELFKASAWAGVLTSFTAFVKYIIGVSNFALFFEGFFFFINYAFGFLAMQKFHLALSSKQPAYTASALARKFEAFKQSRELDEVTSEVKKIMNSQYLTTIGNLLWVVPSVMILDWLWYYMMGSHFMTEIEAMAVMEKHHLYHSLTIPFAILTGVFLWLSSVIAGWVENWLVFRDIPLAMKFNPFLKKILKRDHLNFIANHFAGTMGGIAGNLSIAFFLAFPIIIGKFTAIPLDIRHVTLAAGTVTFALNAIEWDVFSHWDLILNMFLSITVIGLLNFSVSFYCALRMAAMAQNIDPKYLKIIFKYTFVKRQTKI